MRIASHEEAVEYTCQLKTLVPLAEELLGLDSCYDLNFYCLKRPYDSFYLIKDATDWRREVSFEWRQRTNV